MNKTAQKCALGPQESPLAVDTPTPAIHIGMLANDPDSAETRMLLTPEACGMLTSAGIAISMEHGAGTDISFTDEMYVEYGVEIVERETALKAPIVLSYSPLNAPDIYRMTPGAALLCMMGIELADTECIKALLEQKISMGVFENMYSNNDTPVFADIIDEIDGRAAIINVQEALSFEGGGKGVLLSGVAGINPCEVLLIGMGQNIIHAAKAAYAAGAHVAIMDNDISSLLAARDICGQGIDTIAIHPRVLFNRVKSADVIIMGTTSREFSMPRNLSAAMKDNVYVLDIQSSRPSTTVPRTVAMAIANVVVNFFNEMSIKDGFRGMLATTPGMQYGMVTYEGHLTDQLLGSYLSIPSVDISILLSGAN